MKTILLAGAAALALKAAAAGPAWPQDAGTDLGVAFKRSDTVTATCFVPIYRVDAETRTVYGRLADETPDLTGMIFDYDTSAPLFRTWTDNAMKTTGGKSAGNLRVMHGLKVAGKLTEVTFDDVSKAIDIAAEVVDEAEWEMVEKGCYTGFSLGGRYIKKWKDKGDAKKTRYTVNPFEASLVDLPCIPSATFAMKTAGGEEQQVEFIGWAPTDEQIAGKAAELAGEGVEVTDDHTAQAIVALKAEYVDEAAKTEVPAEVVEAATDEVEQAEQVEAADVDAGAGDDASKAAAPGSPEADAAEGLEQVWKARDGSDHKTKAAARAHHAALDAAAAKAANPVTAAVAALKATLNPAEAVTEEAPATYVVDGAAEAFADFAAVKALFDEHVAAKGIYDVKNLASIIQDLSWLTDNSICEAGQERDGSGVPAQLLANLRSLSNSLVTMAREETAEMIAMLQQRGVQVSVFAAEANKTVAVELGEAVKADGAEEALPTITVSAELNEAVGKAVGRIDERAASLLDDETGEPVMKALASVRGEHAALKAQMTEEVMPALAEATEALKAVPAMREELDALKALPMPGAARNAGATAVSKGDDATPEGGRAVSMPGTPDDVIKSLVATHGPDAVSRALIKLAQTQPVGAG